MIVPMLARLAWCQPGFRRRGRILHPAGQETMTMTTTITEIPTRYDHDTDQMVRVHPGRTWYAVSWTGGRNCTTGDYPNVHAACMPVAFLTEEERDRWVDSGPERDVVTLANLPYGWSRRRFVAQALRTNNYWAI